MTYNFSEELKRNISMEHRRHSGVSHAGVSETLVEFERQYADIHASLESLNRAETHVQSLESIVVSLEAIKESTRGEKAVALAMANISLEAVEHSFDLPTNTVSVSLEDGEPEEQTTTMVNKIKGALAAIKESVVQVLGQIGQNLQALLGSVVAGATKFKSKLAELKSNAGNAQGGQDLNLGKSASMLSISGGEVTGASYLKDLSETMKVTGAAMKTFKDADDFKAFGEMVLASSQENGKTDVSAFVKKLTAVNTFKDKDLIGGGKFTIDEYTEEDVELFFNWCTRKFLKFKKKTEAKQGSEEVSAESIFKVTMESDGEDGTEDMEEVPKDKVAMFKRFAFLFLTLTSYTFLAKMAGLTLAAAASSVGLGFGLGMLMVAIGARIITGKWPTINTKSEGGIFSFESVSLENYKDVDMKALAAIASEYTFEREKAPEVKSVVSLDSKQAGTICDMLTNIADGAITYAKSLKDRKAVAKDIDKGLSALKKLEQDKQLARLYGGINSIITIRINEIIKAETELNKYSIDLIRAGVAYVEASVNTKAVETPAEEA